MKNEPALKHLGLCVVLERQRRVSAPDLNVPRFPAGVISVSMVSMGPSGYGFARNSCEGLMMLLDGGEAGLLPHSTGAQVGQAWGDQGRRRVALCSAG